MLASLPVLESDKYLKSHILFTSNSESTLYIVLSYILNRKDEMGGTALIKGPNKILDYFESRLKNLSLVNYEYTFEPNSKERYRSIERIVYNVLSFFNSFMEVHSASTYAARFK